MANANEFTPSFLHEALYNKSLDDMFLSDKTHLILVERKQMSFNFYRSCSRSSRQSVSIADADENRGSVINYPPFPTVPPNVVLQHMIRSDLLSRQNPTTRFNPDHWNAILGQVTIDNLEDFELPRDVPAYIKQYSVSIIKVLARAIEKGDPLMIYAVWACEPVKLKTTVIGFHFTCVDEYTFKKEKVWSPKASRYRVSVPHYYASTFRGEYVATNTKDELIQVLKSRRP